MGVPANFFHIMIPAQKSPKSRAQKYERKIQAQISERKTRNSIFLKFLGNHMMEISWKLNARNFFWKLYAGNLLMETMCWEIRVDAGGLL